MKCPHCLEAFHDQWSQLGANFADAKGEWFVTTTTCAACKQALFALNFKLKTERGAEWRAMSGNLINHHGLNLACRSIARNSARR